MIPVFIYGTLKQGFPLHAKGLSGAAYLGPCQTVKPYPLYIARSFYGPVMLDRPGEGLVVQGELYEADEARLRLIDQLEDVGQPGSFRAKSVVRMLGDGAVLEAVSFLKDESWLEPLHSGYLSDYQDRRFVPAWER
jgi:gamma-glutamylaminecyclotransferase